MFQRETLHTGLSFSRIKCDAELPPSLDKLNSELEQEVLLSNVFVICRIFTQCEILSRQCTNTVIPKITHTCLTMTLFHTCISFRML